MKLANLTVNYKLLSDAIDFYKGKGYVQIEVPWMVERPYSLATCPSEEFAYEVDRFRSSTRHHLVGSAEQGFMQMMDMGKLSNHQKYMAVSPCFRNEDETDIHCKQFIKLELFQCTQYQYASSAREATETSYDYNPLPSQMPQDALELFKSLGADKAELVYTGSNDPYSDYDSHKAYDLISEDIYAPKKGTDEFIEVGSYGLRRISSKQIDSNVYRWYRYGTGLALPRFQLVV